MSGSIEQYFGELADPRRNQGKRHSLVAIITVTILGMICGADEWTEIEDVAHAKIEWLRRFLDLPHGVPSHDTLGRVFARLDPREFERCLGEWITHLADLTESKLISVDGKTLRRSYDPADGKAALHMVSAWCQANRLVLGQVATDQKSNEITAIPRLLRLLDLEGAVVTIDAMGTQKQIVRQIVEQGGDYLLPVKENQPALYRDVTLFFAGLLTETKTCRQVPHAHARAVSKAHGRLEVRQAWSVWEIDWLPGRHEWSGLQSLCKVSSASRPSAGTLAARWPRQPTRPRSGATTSAAWTAATRVACWA
jgi:predicted transposase YbfD/YdcC